MDALFAKRRQRIFYALWLRSILWTGSSRHGKNGLRPLRLEHSSDAVVTTRALAMFLFPFTSLAVNKKLQHVREVVSKTKKLAVNVARPLLKRIASFWIFD